jgi:hypothetical protein
MWTIGCRLAPTVEAMVGINSLHVRPTANRFLSAPPDSKNDPKPGESRNSGCSLFPSLFLLCYLLLQKSSKSLTSLSDCPVRRSIASLFFRKISLFPGKNRDFL